MLIRRLLDLEWRALGVVAKAATLPLGCLLRRADRHLVWRLHAACFGAQRPGVYPDVALAEVCDPAEPVVLHDLVADTFNVTEPELLVLAGLARRVRARTVFELGTADGRTTRNLAANLEPGGEVFTLNLPLEDDPGHWQGVPLGARFLGTAEEERITQLIGDSRTFDFSPYAGRCQLVFVDADHAEESVWSDTHTALGVIDRRMGVIAWHDALRYGVQRALPRAARELGLPIHLVAGTNVAIACFAHGRAVRPQSWPVAAPRPGAFPTRTDP